MPYVLCVRFGLCTLSAFKLPILITLTEVGNDDKKQKNSGLIYYPLF